MPEKSHQKIIIAIAVIMLTLVFLMGWWWFYRPQTAIERVLPSGAVAYVRLSQGTWLWENFTKSAFYQQLSRVDLNKVLTRNHVDPQDIKQILNMKQELELLTQDPWVKRLLAKEVVVAFYPDNPKGYYPLLAVRLDRTLQAAQSLLERLSLSTKDVQVSFSHLDNQQITDVYIKKNQRHIYMMHIHDVSVIAMEKSSQLQGVVNAIKLKENVLASDAHWLFNQQQAYHLAGVDGYLVPGAFISKKSPLAEQTRSFKTVSLSAAFDKTSRFNLALDLDQKLAQAQYRTIASCQKHSPTDSMALVPANVIAYHWGNCYDFQQYWRDIKVQLTEYPLFEQEFTHYTKAFKRYIGVDFEDELLPLIGDEVGGYLTDIDTTALFPYPRFLFFIKINDTAKVKALMDKINERLPQRLNQENYSGAQVTSLNLPVGSNTDPGFAFVGQYFLLASSSQLLKKSIDTFAVPARGLLTDHIVNDLEIAKVNDVNAVVLLRTEALVKRAKSLVDWADKFLASQVSMAASYQKEWDARQGDYDGLVDEKQTERKIAQERLGQLKLKIDEDVSEQVNLIEGDITKIDGEIADIKAQKAEAAKTVANYQVQAQAAKLMMFNTDNLIRPVLSAFETIQAQSIKTRIDANLLKTEIIYQ